MPFVRFVDLGTNPKGDKVLCHAVDRMGGRPIMNDKNAEGMGVPMAFSDFEVKIGLATFVVDSGGAMSRMTR